MSEEVSEVLLRRLRDLRRGLLHLHKVLLDIERADYEKEHGRASSGEMLQLVINHKQFAWLHAISELIVRIDEMFDAEESAANVTLQSLIEEGKSLLQPSESGNDFAQKYHAILQREPAALVAHGEVTKILSVGAD